MNKAKIKMGVRDGVWFDSNYIVPNELYCKVFFVNEDKIKLASTSFSRFSTCSQYQAMRFSKTKNALACLS